MNLQLDTSAGLRRAALALHALGEADREWLLSRLPAQSRETLDPLLVELGELGIAPDDAVIRVALSEVVADAPVATDEARALCAVLADEAPAVQSLLLAALPASQRDAVLQHWPHELFARPSAVAVPAWTPALHAAVMQSWRELARLQEVAS